MTVTNKNRVTYSLGSLGIALLMAAGLFFSAGSASASKQALARINVFNTFIAPGIIYSRFTGTDYVTVATPTPTPSVMWNSSVVQGTTSFSFSAIYTPFLSLMTNHTLNAGTIQKSWLHAAPSGGSTLMGAPSPTTKCFKSTYTAMPGPPALPNECFPRIGSGSRTPGAKKYGGTARMIQGGGVVGTFLNFAVGSFDLVSAIQMATPQLTGTSYPGNYGIQGTGVRTGTVINTARRTMSVDSPNPWTTGRVTAMGGAFNTQLTYTGSNNFNTTNLTGMISMVQPFLRRAFQRDSSGTYLGPTNEAAATRRIFFTFAGEVPEPGTLAMLAFGTLGLAGLAGRRRR